MSLSPEERAACVFVAAEKDDRERPCPTPELVAQAIRSAIMAEREACLSACQRVAYHVCEGEPNGSAGACCEAIRARGEK